MKTKSVLTRFHNCLILRGGKIISEDLWVRDGKIANPEQVFYVEQLEADVTVNCKGFLIAPGFIDIQINGGMGVDFSFDTENIEEGINIVAKELISHGVTSFCPTMVTSDVEKYRKILPKIKKAQGGKHGATVLGVHLEGPFISLAKKGAHMEKYIKVPEKGLESIKEVYGSLENVVIVTLAPELEGALDVIRGLSELGIKVALGHSTASLAEGDKAIENGANLITHLFNAMLPFHHRDPGLVGLLASNTKKQVYYGIISDGIHTHPAALRIASRTNKEGLVLVSDAVAAQGLADGNHRIGPQAVCVVAGKAYVAGTDTLCGSTAALDECVVTFKRSLDCSLEYALQAASLHPARALGIDDRKGKLDFGYDADFILLHPETLKVQSTWIAGLVLVSDAVAAQGLADGNHRIGPQAVCVVAGKAYVAGTDTLCGSTAALDECVVTFKRSLDCSLEYALQAASLHPARALGIDDRKGKLDFGYDADFILLHPETLKVQSTWIAGECVASHGLL